jgi:Flp pilus assembly protein TadD
MSFRLTLLCFFAISAWGQSNAMLAANKAIPMGRETLSEDEFFNQSEFETREKSTPSTVSAELLRHPLSGKAAKLLDRARRYSHAGEHAKAVEELRLALKEPSATVYAHGMLGTEYLWLNQVPDALGELELAVQLLPHDVASRSNLGYALYLLGQKDRGEQEVRLALSLDVNNHQTRFVLGLLEQSTPTAK